MQRNKKLGSKNKDYAVKCANNKLKRDYINYYDYLDFFTEEYKILDNECRKNLEQISKSLVEITIAKGDN